MASLFQDKRGNYHSRKRIPDDCRADYKNLYGQGHEAKFYAPVSVGRAEAQRLFHEWEAEVTGRFETIRRTQRGDGIDLTYKQAAGLAGEWYKWFLAQYQDNPGDPVGYSEALDDLIDTMRHHYARLVDGYVIKDGRAVDFKPEVWAADVHRDPDVRKEMRPVIADQGHTAQFLAGRGVVLTNKARDLFLDCALLNAVPALIRLERNASGDYSPDELLKTFPEFDQNKAAQHAGLTPVELFEAWAKHRQPKHSTVESWRTVFRVLAKQFPSAAEITPNQAQAWIDGLITKGSPAETIRKRKGRSAFTVRNTWLRATKAVYAWAVKRRMVPNNPFAEVIVEKHKRPQRRPKHLYDHEITMILKAASATDDHTDNPDAAAQRWVPWLLAYTGARPSEVTQLRSQDVKQIDGIWCVDFNPEAGAIKTDEARVSRSALFDGSEVTLFGG